MKWINETERLPDNAIKQQISPQVYEINKTADIAIEYCDKYLSKGILYFNSMKQSFVTIKHLASSITVNGDSESGEKKFTLKEALSIWNDGFTTCQTKNGTKTSYFKDKFGIDI